MGIAGLLLQPFYTENIFMDIFIKYSFHIIFFIINKKYTPRIHPASATPPNLEKTSAGVL
jgi:hypothetical protein